MSRLKRYARIVLCGAIEAYNTGVPSAQLSNYLALISQEATMRGFIVFSYASRYGEAERQMVRWLEEVTSRPIC